MSDELKPCPFCGSPAESRPGGIFCSNVDWKCSVKPGIANSMRSVVAEWNRRAPPVSAPVEVTESADELPSGVQMIALRRFAECCEDADAGGHDVRKETVKSLCELGALRSIGFGRHETTKYGDWLLERDTALAQRGETP